MTPTLVRRALADRPPRRLELPGHARAAVLVPLFEGPAGWELLFTVRASGLARHAGQIAFPGGRLEPGEDAVAAALREAFEEVGLRVDPADVLGALDDRVSPYALIATPIVARIPAPEALALDPGEVAEAFTLPLARLQATPVRRGWRERDGRRFEVVHYDVDDRCVWGLTGAVLEDLLARLAAPPPLGVA